MPDLFNILKKMQQLDAKMLRLFFYRFYFLKSIMNKTRSQSAH